MNMDCRECKQPLSVVAGGNKTDIGSTVIKMVHVWGCINPDCSIKGIEQYRTETEEPSFNG